jgi:hypothetical protein
MGKKKTTQKTTPTIQQPLQQPLQNFTQNTIGQIAASDPTRYIAPASPLQEQAFAQAGQMGSAQNPYLPTALSMTQAAGNAPPSFMTATGYNAPRLGAAPQGTAPQGTAAQLGQIPTYGGATVDPTTNAQAFTADWRSILGDGGIQQFMNPALESYLNPTLRAYDQEAGEARAQMRGQAAGAGAFGGSRYGLQEGAFDARTELGRAQLEGQTRLQAFQDATQTALAEAARRQGLDLTNAATRTGVSGANAAAANQRAALQAQLGQQAGLQTQQLGAQRVFQQGQQDQETMMQNLGLQGQYGLQNLGLQGQYGLTQFGADTEAARYGADVTNRAAEYNASAQEQAYQRALQASGLYGGLANQYGTDQRANLGMMADLGGIQRGISSEMAGAPLTQAQLLSGLYGGLYPAYVGQNAVGTQSGGLGGAILGGLAQGIGGGLMGGAKPWIFSDQRLKTDIERIGDLGALGLYRFRYIGNDVVWIGVMADEVAEHAPHALGPVIGGYATVDYSKLMEA